MSGVKNSKKEQNFITKFYLLLYNILQTLGWSYLLYNIVGYYLSDKKNLPSKDLWSNVKLVVCIFQNAAALEIIHAAIGIVPSNVLITTFQVLSRLMVVNGVLLATPTGPQSPGLPLCLIAWAVTEIIRYLFYTLNLIGKIPYILVWSRYTFFIILYPLGVTGELLCFYWAQAYVSEHKIFTAELPNYWNFTFSYNYLLISIMLLYIPLFPQMYLHMFSQRRKVIGGQKVKKSK
ncbi:ptpla domain protein, putative [Pediculus humanus corporis]|uniref:Very-long-chain (3R)-3-hydroxyacyl-CoA dehydratase n=1 Tax=Pediculus humanus subsp. corporis TaxID=121224 RepID=E0VBY6_PEDHC|nr:ptpla domain protein, putative [Pediculus humanus corporis]EEB10892.1 ptpla domain protein, putative [Pediculus humanus corporis]